MSYPFINASQQITNQTPKEQYTNLFQETLNQQFYDTSDWYTIQEETTLASGSYQSVDVRINSLIDPSTGDNIEDDYKKLLFKNIDHPVSLGKLYSFDNNYWITVNIDKIKTLSATAVIRRCNNTLRWIDEETGGFYELPCYLSYLINENRNYSTAGSAQVTPSGMLTCIVQYNQFSNKIVPNQRFLFGNPSNWTAYKIQGGGVNNYNNLDTYNKTSVGFIRLSMAVDYLNKQTDDLTNGIANAYTNVYILTLSSSTLTAQEGQTIQIIPILTLNGKTVTKDLVWESEDETIATVDSSGLVTFVASGTTNVNCSLLNNSSINASCSIHVITSPTNVFQVLFSPDKNYILEGEEQTWEVYLYENGVQQPDTFTFSLNSNAVPPGHYVYSVIDGNSFKIENVERFLTDVLEITATSGLNEGSITTQLKGAW